MAFLANLYPLRQLLYGYPILLYGVMLSIACACLLKWEETGVPGGNPRKHGENMQTPHRKARAGPETNPGPSCCEATALTTAPPCRPAIPSLRKYNLYKCLFQLFVFVRTCRSYHIRSPTGTSYPLSTGHFIYSLMHATLLNLQVIFRSTSSNQCRSYFLATGISNPFSPRTEEET